MAGHAPCGVRKVEREAALGHADPAGRTPGTTAATPTSNVNDDGDDRQRQPRAAFETLVTHWNLLTGGFQGTSDAGLWLSVIFAEGFVKPLVYGTATGLACAEFSGLGRGYDGFSARYVKAFVLAVVANALYQVGVYLLSFVGQQPLGQILGIVWGLLILGLLVLRLRNVLHLGLMEAALERSAREGGVGEHGELGFCPRCEMPLMAGSRFCSACGTSLRATGRRSRIPDGSGGAAPAAPGAQETRGELG